MLAIVINIKITKTKTSFLATCTLGNLLYNNFSNYSFGKLFDLSLKLIDSNFFFLLLKVLIILTLKTRVKPLTRYFQSDFCQSFFFFLGFCRSQPLIAKKQLVEKLLVKTQSLTLSLQGFLLEYFYNLIQWFCVIAQPRC